MLKIVDLKVTPYRRKNIFMVSFLNSRTSRVGVNLIHGNNKFTVLVYLPQTKPKNKNVCTDKEKTNIKANVSCD